ncbi:MutT motif protein [Nile crocodilepox virus]|uniref:MutT motif protein n=1 Tax=Nile crocodilepox virus (isolate Crocodylus niloticus/Zimbabwe/Ume/2001) TaxID=1289473 RepID=Q070D5_CPRVZ|nr:MutT motif protein [Nile crocodilepox virus]ABJ09007.1 MutT motif protein [Nile crocodilepox virus]
MFETPREAVTVRRATIAEIADCDRFHNLHLFGLCLTTDRVPIVGVRRTSFTYQNKWLSRRRGEQLVMKYIDFKYVYPKEIKDIRARLATAAELPSNDGFEELTLLGGSVRNRRETIEKCIHREIAEETDDSLRIGTITDVACAIDILDKSTGKTFRGYCILCLLNQPYSDVPKDSLYNMEVEYLCSLLEKSGNEKFAYLNHIYEQLVEGLALDAPPLGDGGQQLPVPEPAKA